MRAEGKMTLDEVLVWNVRPDIRSEEKWERMEFVKQTNYCSGILSASHSISGMEIPKRRAPFFQQSP